MDKETALKRREIARRNIELARQGKIPVDDNWDPLGEGRNDLQASLDGDAEEEALKS